MEAGNGAIAEDLEAKDQVRDLGAMRGSSCRGLRRDMGLTPISTVQWAQDGHLGSIM